MPKHITLEYYYADFHEQQLFHLSEENRLKVIELFKNGDAHAIREILDETEYTSGLWYDEPYNLHFSIDIDGECIQSGHASEFVHDGSMISAQALCPTLEYCNRICSEAGVLPERYKKENEILFLQPGNKEGKRLLDKSNIWKEKAKDTAEQFTKEQENNLELDINDKIYWCDDKTPHMCLFDSFLEQYGLEEQEIIVESLKGECEYTLEFDIEEDFEIDKLKFIYDEIENPDTEFGDEQIMLDRIVYDNKLYGGNGGRFSYSSDKFVIAKINHMYPGWLKYESEMELE